MRWNYSGEDIEAEAVTRRTEAHSQANYVQVEHDSISWSSRRTTRHQSPSEQCRWDNAKYKSGSDEFIIESFASIAISSPESNLNLRVLVQLLQICWVTLDSSSCFEVGSLLHSTDDHLCVWRSWILQHWPEVVETSSFPAVALFLLSIRVIEWCLFYMIIQSINLVIIYRSSLKMERMTLTDLTPRVSYTAYLFASLRGNPKDLIKYEPLRIHNERWCHFYDQEITNGTVNEYYDSNQINWRFLNCSVHNYLLLKTEKD